MGTRHFLFLTLLLLLSGCTSLLPQSQTKTLNHWSSYQQLQQAFDGITPHQTTVADLRQLHFLPTENPNIRILNYSDILRHFIPSPSINADELDAGVQECIKAKTACQGYEINEKALHRQRVGNFFLDFFKFDRQVDVVGWRFNGLLLIRNDTVIYKLSGGDPVIHEFEDDKVPLGPAQIF